MVHCNIALNICTDGDSRRVKKDVSLARKHGKVFIAGEYGFLDHANDYAIFLSAAEKEGCGGSLVWSLRPHSAQGGFKASSVHPPHGGSNSLTKLLADTPRRRVELRLPCSRMAICRQSA